jgi:hypothetical protein
MKKSNKVSKRDEGAMVLSYGYSLKTKTGRIKRRATKKCNSFTGNFIKLLRVTMGKVYYIQLPDYSNTLRDVYTSGLMFYVTGGVGDGTVGIAVGTGVTAVDINDYDLATRIAHGVSAGELQYSAQAYTAPSSDATSTTLVLTRDFTNDSGGSITVNEIGLFSRPSSYGTLIIRDVITPVAVGNGEKLTINYNIKTTI